MYKNDIKYVAGHKGGYVSEDELGTTGTPENTVIDCNNMDFREGYDERRNPYNTVAVTGLSLPSGYVIHNYAKKEFIDYQGNSQHIYVIVATKAPMGTGPSITYYKTKIFMSGYYCPASTAENYYGTTPPGFNTEWIEVTEYYLSEITSDGSYLYSTDATLLAKQEDYFKGFFVFSTVTGHVTGIVTSSEVATGSQKLTCSLETGEILGTTGDCGICRFPVNFFNESVWDDITDVTISDEMPNVLRFACGDGSRTLWLGMIKDRKWFNQAYVAGTIVPTGVPFVTGIQGTYLGSEAATFEVKCITVWKPFGSVIYYEFQYRRNSEDWQTLTNAVRSDGHFIPGDVTSGFTAPIGFGLKVSIQSAAELEVANIATIPIQSLEDNLGVSWDGFWFGYDIPQVLDKNKYTYKSDSTDAVNITKDEIGYELGIWYDTDQEYLANYAYGDRVYSLCVELDGFQTILVRQILSNDYREQIIYGTLDKWFDRRITASLLFYDEMNNMTPAQMTGTILPLSYLCDDNVPGYHRISKWAAVVTSNAYRFPITTLTGYGEVYPEGSSTYISTIKKYATGLSLNSYLNQEYWKNVTTNAAKIIKVGESLVAVKIAQDVVETDLEDASSSSQIGKFSICIGNVQNAGVNTHSVMCSERIFEMTREEIVTAVETEPEQFLVFSKEKCYWNEILDAQAGTLKNIGTFLNRGATSAKAVVRAIFTDKAPMGTADYKYSASQFSGVFFASYDSIYGFFNNEPVDLLAGRWRKTYRNLSIAIKEGIVGGYYPNRKEVWFNINNVIYVFSLEYKHWKKYTLVSGDTQSNIYYDEDGQITWHNNSLFFRLTADWEDRVTGNTYKDKGTDYIPFYIKKKLNHGNVDMLKIPHRISMFYDISASAGIVTLDVSSDDNTSDVLTKIITLTGATSFRQGFAIRKMCNHYTVEISSDEGTDTPTIANIVMFKINQLSLKAKLTAGTLSKG